MYVINPFLVPFLKVELGFPASLSIYAYTSMRIGGILALIPWGKFADRLGNRIVFIFSFAIGAVAYLLLFFIPPFPEKGMLAFLQATIGFMILGIGSSGVGIAYSVRMMYEAKKEFSGVYLTVGALVGNLSHALLPFVAGMILEHVPRTVVIFGSEMFSKRLFLLFMVLHMLISIYFIRFLRRIEEGHAKEILGFIVFTSLNRLNSQLLRIRRLLQKTGSS